MVYRGTGTQADPMIPSTITELLQCLSDARENNSHIAGGYYIKLESDIDCADDINYIGYTTRLNFGSSVDTTGTNTSSAVVSLYSDNSCTIRGLTVKDAYFFSLCSQNATYNTVIKNVNFIDCFFKPDNSNPAFCVNASYSYFFNCIFSIMVYPYNNIVPKWSQSVSSYGAVKNCSLYIKFMGGYLGTSSSTFYYSNNTTNRETQNNIIILEGLNIQGNLNNGQNLFDFSRQGANNRYNSIILKNCTINPQSTTNYYLLNNGSYNYIAVINPTIDSTITQAVSLLSINTQYSIIACPQDKYGTTAGYIIKPGSTANVIYYLTLDELKSESKLLEIGFVP